MNTIILDDGSYVYTSAIEKSFGKPIKLKTLKLGLESDLGYKEKIGIVKAIRQIGWKGYSCCPQLHKLTSSPGMLGHLSMLALSEISPNFVDTFSFEHYERTKVKRYKKSTSYFYDDYD